MNNVKDPRKKLIRIIGDFLADNKKLDNANTITAFYQAYNLGIEKGILECTDLGNEVLSNMKATKEASSQIKLK